MKNLFTEKIKQYYFVKDGIIFDISYSNNSGDECAKAWKDVTLPSISVKENVESESTIYYLDSYINDGDKYANNKFSKVIHKGDPIYSGEEKISSFTEYYKALCEKEIIKTVQNHFDIKTEEIINKKGSFFPIPSWMIKNNGYTITPDIQIDITTDYINNLRKKIVQDEAYKAMTNIADFYGYTVTEPAEPTDIEVMPKSN